MQVNSRFLPQPCDNSHNKSLLLSIVIPNQACPSEKQNECKGKKNIESEACDKKTFRFIHVHGKWSLHRPGTWRCERNTTTSWSTSWRHYDLRCNMYASLCGSCLVWIFVTINLNQFAVFFCANTTRSPKVSQVPRLCMNSSAEKRKAHSFVALVLFKHDQDPRLDKAALGTLNTRLSRELKVSIGQGGFRAVKRRL